MTRNDDKRLTLIELNEFSVDLLRRGVDELGLRNIERMLAMRACRTSTDDQVEHRGLDPWVQWVSAHTGVPSSEHGILHLGDTPGQLGVRQLWERLSERGWSSGIWGAMNATRADASECRFFLPDPWTFSERAYPEELNGLLQLPRYYSTNYLDVSKRQFAGGMWALFKFLLTSGALPGILRQSPLAIRSFLRVGINNALLFSLFDLFSTVAFLRYKRKYRPQLSLIFLNSIAHLQHHKWQPAAKLTPELTVGLTVIDRVLELLFAALEPGEAVVVMNALTQRNIAGEKPRICYRQISPARFLASVGIGFQSVEQLMTNDAHVFFASTAERDAAAAALAAARIHGEPLFQVETSARDPLRLFYQVDFWDELEQDVKVSVNGHEINYLDHFEAIVARTGAHVREGDALFEGIELPPQMPNHALAEHVLAYFP
jgi:hypothetical protein